MKKKKYIVRGVVISTIIIGEFEADSEEEAIEKAEVSDYDVPGLCWECSGSVELNDDVERFYAEEI